MFLCLLLETETEQTHPALFSSPSLTAAASITDRNSPSHSPEVSKAHLDENECIKETESLYFHHHTAAASSTSYESHSPSLQHKHQHRSIHPHLQLRRKTTQSDQKSQRQKLLKREIEKKANKTVFISINKRFYSVPS